MTHSNNAAATTETKDIDVCGCMTFGGIMFIISAIVFLTTNSTAQAFINLAQ